MGPRVELKGSCVKVLVGHRLFLKVRIRILWFLSGEVLTK